VGGFSITLKGKKGKKEKLGKEALKNGKWGGFLGRWDGLAD